ncbi:MAG: M56 family metallopeptidase [Sphingomicrobium sp.]
MQVLIAIALKSLLIAGLTLGLLALMKRRSAAERSWVAHIGLLALVIMAFAPLVLPAWNVEAPALLGQAPTAEAAVQTAAPQILPGTGRGTATRSGVVVGAHGRTPQLGWVPFPSYAASPPRAGEDLLNPAAAATVAYALPAAVLLFITFLALARLITLRARAEVLVDGHWLSALARAQRRMGFKHGTALLTSDELSSPVSWGLMRPVILLNTRAVEASGEAEAIIAHELAHVARMDWAKLLLARVATALFWFNPLVWLLAREAHQLREEAADDAVLAADIADTDYAQLLVGVARHETPGLLLGAHGVAPSKSSLARRVARVLDGASVRGPVARSFALGVFVGAVLIAAPLAALTLTPGGPKLATPSPATDKVQRYYGRSTTTPEVHGDLPHIIASGVSTSIATAVAAVSQDQSDGADIAAERANAAREAAFDRADAVRGAAMERAQAIAEQAREKAHDYGNRADAMRAVGVTPEYIAAMRSAAPQLARHRAKDFITMKAVGVSPAYVQELASAGLARLTLNQLVEARAIGLSGGYVRGVVAAGARPEVEGLVQLRTLSITPAQVAEARRAGAVSNGQIASTVMSLGVRRQLNGWPFTGSARPPKPPPPPRIGRPAASPPDWDAPEQDEPDGG